MSRKSRHILPAALLISAVLHLLAYGSFLVFRSREAPPVRPGEGESPVVLIEIGLVSVPAVAPVAPAVPPSATEPSDPLAGEAGIATALLSPPDPSESGDQGPAETDPPPVPESLPDFTGRAGREEVTRGSAADDYLRLVRRRIEEAMFYPRRAKLRRLEGTVRVSFMIEPGGQLRSPQLLEPSPHELFNRAALDILERAAPFPPPGPEINGRPLSVSISFESTY